MPAVSGSAVRGKDGKVYIALSNLDPKETNRVTVSLEGLNERSVQGRILTAPAINSHNDFDRPNVVRPVSFKGARVSGGNLVVDMPSKSVVILQVQ